MTGRMETIPGGLTVCLRPGVAPLTDDERATLAEYAQWRRDRAAIETRYQGDERAEQLAALRADYEARHATTAPAGTEEATLL